MLVVVTVDVKAIQLLIRRTGGGEEENCCCRNAMFRSVFHPLQLEKRKRGVGVQDNAVWCVCASDNAAWRSLPRFWA